MNGLMQALGAIASHKGSKPPQPAPNLDRTTAESRAAWSAYVYGDSDFEQQRFDDVSAAEGIETTDDAHYEIHRLAQRELDALHAEALVMNQPSPGSAAALSAGCQCPRMDNSNGAGYLGGDAKDSDGNPVFFINAGCPLHGGGKAKRNQPASHEPDEQERDRR